MKKEELKKILSWSIIVVLIAVMPILAFKIAGLFSGWSCNTALTEFETSLKSAAFALNDNEAVQWSHDRPCRISTLYITDNESSELAKTPQLSNAISSSNAENANAFLIEDSRLKHSFSFGTRIPEPKYLCTDASSGAINLMLEKREGKLNIRNAIDSANCGPVQIAQEPVLSIIIQDLADSDSTLNATLPESLSFSQESAISSSEVTREITCSKSQSEATIKIKAKEGRRLKGFTYIEYITKDCLNELDKDEKALPLNISVNNQPLAEINSPSIYPLIIWDFKSGELSSSNLLMSYTTNKCLRKCPIGTIKGILLAKKVYNLDISDEIKSIELKLTDDRPLDAIKSSAIKGDFSSAISRAESLYNKVNDEETGELLLQLIEEIKGMQKEADKSSPEAKNETIFSGATQ